jgi:anti-sigma factor RsiW
MQSITQDDLMLYIYGEASTEQTAAIKAALQTDWKLNEQYQELLSAKESLGPVNVSPRKKALDFVLNYASKQVKEFTD